MDRAQRSFVGSMQALQKVRDDQNSTQKQLEQIRKMRSTFISQQRKTYSELDATVEESRRKKAFDLAFSYTPSTDTESSSPTESASPPPHAKRFQDMKGVLLFPIAKRSSVRPSTHHEAGGPGIDILAPAGTIVRSVFAGRVAFADRYGSYGRLVILDHGDHYYSVSGHLESVDVKVGDELSAGEKIGQVGDDGTASFLYFELRHRSTTIPSESWFAQ